MTLRISVAPGLLEWAAERSGRDQDELLKRFPRLQLWLAGTARPTLNQLEQYSRATSTPVGYFYLEEPPEETVPIPDFRTVGNVGVGRPSADLLDTIYQCEQRQEWYRFWAIAHGYEKVPYVGSVTTNVDPADVAAEIRELLDYQVGSRGTSWSDALRLLRERAEGLGFLVMVNGIVGSNTHRKLDPDEFRGFALVDDTAPTVFVNGADTKAAQIFTLLHELAHLWLGHSSLDAMTLNRPLVGGVEHWCNAVAAEVAVPAAALEDAFNENAELTGELDRLASIFKVSTLVALRRLYEGGKFDWEEFRVLYGEELQRVLALAEGRTGTGGDFYKTQPARVSPTFAKAVITDTLEGRTTYSEAFSMLGVRKGSTFDELGQRLGVA